MQLSVGCFVQLAIKVKTAKVSEIVNEISKKAIACRTWYDGECYIYTPEKCPTFRIPDHFQSLEEARTYVSSNHSIPDIQRMACVCYNSDMIVLNANHCMSDGGYYKMLLDYLINGKDPGDSNYCLHESSADAFAKIFDSIELKKCDSSTTKVASKNLNHPDPVKINAFYVPFDIPFENLAAFSNDKCHGLTEKILSSVIMAVSTFNGSFTDAKVVSAVDMRRFLKKPGFRNANHDSLISVHAKGINNSSSFGDMAMAFRRDLNDKLENNESLYSLKELLTGDLSIMEWADYSTCGISNMGSIKTGGDILDVNIGTSIRGPASPPGSLSIISHSVDDKILRGKLYCDPYVMKWEDATKFTHAVEHCLTNIRDDMKIGKIMKEIQDIYRF